MGLYEQPNDYSCGPFALKHALVALGRIADERRIAKVARTHWWAGTNEVRLARAARVHDCEMPFARRLEAESARRTLVRYLGRGIPVLLCVDDWGHWVTAVRHEGGRFVILDSRDEPVAKVLEWPELRRRWQYDEEDGRTLFDLHPVVPRSGERVVARFTVARAHRLRRPENRDLAQHWDEYLGDLLEMCRPPGGKVRLAVSMAEFLRRHGPLLLDGVGHWYGSPVPREDLARVLRDLRFVAETYGLVVPVVAWRRALVDLAAILALWACARGGAPAVYGEEPALDRARTRRPRRRGATRRVTPVARRRHAKARANPKRRRPVRTIRRKSTRVAARRSRPAARRKR